MSFSKKKDFRLQSFDCLCEQPITSLTVNVLAKLQICRTDKNPDFVRVVRGHEFGSVRFEFSSLPISSAAVRNTVQTSGKTAGAGVIVDCR